MSLDSIVAKKLAVITDVKPANAARTLLWQWPGQVEVAVQGQICTLWIEAWQSRLGVFHIRTEEIDRDKRDGACHRKGNATESNEQIVVRRLGISKVRAVPGRGTSETTFVFKLRNWKSGQEKSGRYLVQMHLDPGEETDPQALPCLLDADFRGTRLPESLLDDLMAMEAGQETCFASSFEWDRGLQETSAQMPSGDGLPGGRFHSWFQIIERRAVEPMNASAPSRARRPGGR